jgi:hypothetical protein
MTLTLLTETEARAFLGGLGRSTLWKYYADCRIALTDSKRPAIAWDKDKLEQRARFIARSQRRYGGGPPKRDSVEP